MPIPTPFKPSQNHWNLPGLFALGLLSLILVTMIAIVIVQHNIRGLETIYAEKITTQSQQHEEWGKLSLEKHHLSAPARVEQIAREKLGMSIEASKEPDNRQIIFLENFSQELMLPEAERGYK